MKGLNTWTVRRRCIETFVTKRLLVVGGTAAAAVIVSASSCRLTDAFVGPAGANGFGLRWFTALADSNDWIGFPAVTGRAVVIAKRGGLAALDTATGAVLWQTRVTRRPDERMLPGNIIVHGNLVCAIDKHGSACLSSATGAVVWSASADSATDAASASADNSAIYYGTRNHRIVSVSLADGSSRWSTDVAPAAPFATRVFGTAVRGDTVYATTVRWLNWNGFPVAGDLIALDARNGRVLWSYTPAPGDTSGFQTPPVLTGNLAIVSDVYYHGIRAINLRSHTEVWRTPKDASGYIGSETAPAVVGDTVFAGSTDTHVFALDRITGAERWRVIAGGGSFMSIALCNNYVIAQTLGDPRAVDRATHVSLRGRLLDSGDFLQSGVTAAGNTAYALGQHGVYAMSCR